MPDYAKALNEAQYAAATAEENAVLVVAGAGSGKTRAIVHRLAWLVERGAAPQSILLLTFTRKAAREMLDRASMLLNMGMHGVAGGTFHSFAYSALRRHPPGWLEGRSFTLMDPADMTQAARQCKETLNLGKKDNSFPKIQTIVDILSKSRNKELPVPEILRRDSYHLLPYADAIMEIGHAYAAFRKQHGLMDYDDLLFELEALLRADGAASRALRGELTDILVDEYQDTNLVQARLVELLARPGGDGPGARVMAVGDEAQSIYAFRGANVRNILDFPKIFPGARIIRLEENYRSTQPILDVANNILAHAPESYKKKLFTRKEGGRKVRLVTTVSDISQADLVANRIAELLEEYQPGEIAVLFRSGFHSYPLENALRRSGMAFRKYGGLRFVEAAHVKDILSFARLIINPLDLPSLTRLAAMHKGMGPKTIAKIHGLMLKNDAAALKKACARFPGFLADLAFVEQMRGCDPAPVELFDRLLEYYRPRLETLYPEDWPRRQQGLEEILLMAQGYDALDYFLADLALEAPVDNGGGEDENYITLSTVHSAKGLEWDAVLIIDMVEDRFPSRHAQARPEDYEEERRLFYVACTRARHVLELYAPSTIYSRAEHATVPVAKSPFVYELSAASLENYREGMGLVTESGRERPAPARRPLAKTPPAEERLIAETKLKVDPRKLGYCRHRIFGRGKIVKILDEEKAQVNFPGFGLKIILKDYLIPEDE